MKQSGRAFQQPRGIAICFLTEMWERFGFYVTQALLILYMTRQLGLSDAVSNTILGTFGAFVYITPVIGGYLADRILGYRHSVIVGGVFFIAGYSLLGLMEESLFYYGLAMIIIGNGFFKPNISTFLGTLYKSHDLRREKGFTIFYVGINVGSLLATVSAGYIVRYIGWGASFFASAIGLAFGLGVFIIGLSYLSRRKQLVIIEKPELIARYIFYTPIVYVGALVSLFLLANLLQMIALGDAFLSISGVVILGMLIYFYWHSPSTERINLLVCTILILMSVIFWGLYFQLFYAMNLFVDRIVDHEIFGIVLPTPLFISIEAFFVVVLGPFLGILWQRLSVKKRNPSPAFKFALSLLMTSLGFSVLWLSVATLAPDHLVAKWWIVAAYFLITFGELLLSPIGLSMITELAPRHLLGALMGVWFVAMGFGGKLAGVFANYAAIPVGVDDHGTVVAIYTHALSIYSLVAFCAFIVMLFLSHLIKNLSKEQV